MARKIDHIIVKLPYEELQNPPAWLTQAFHLSPGGRHADGLTENKLIIFKDGSYIELIAFIDEYDKAGKDHWWANHPYGIIDWALTSDSPDDVLQVTEKLDSSTVIHSIGYKPAIDGGRIKADGTELKWKVTFPQHVTRGEAPFWCHDMTPRELRVPTDEISKTHPCGALGISQVTLSIPDSVSDFQLEALNDFYTCLFGAPKGKAIIDTSTQLDTVHPVSTTDKPQLVIQTLTSDRAEAFVESIALFTDTVGIGQSRDTLLEWLGGEEIEIGFDHGRRA